MPVVPLRVKTNARCIACCHQAGCMFSLFRAKLTMTSSCDFTDLLHCECTCKRESESSLTSPRLLKTKVVWLRLPPVFLIHSGRSVLLILLGHSCWSADLSELLRVRHCRSICVEGIGVIFLNFKTLLDIIDMISELTPGPRFPHTYGRPITPLPLLKGDPPVYWGLS